MKTNKSRFFLESESTGVLSECSYKYVILQGCLGRNSEAMMVKSVEVGGIAYQDAVVIDKPSFEFC